MVTSEFNSAPKLFHFPVPGWTCWKVLSNESFRSFAQPWSQEEHAVNGQTNIAENLLGGPFPSASLPASSQTAAWRPRCKALRTPASGGLGRD